MFEKILIANRGEIAIRVIRACRLLGIENVAVFSDADKGALHVRMANQAYRIGPAAPTESYLVMEKIIDAARKCGADAIHPGYGFLAENWQFAKKVEEAGITFIGPSAESIRLLGDKLEARKLALEANVPVVPGGPVNASELDKARELAKECGYPVLVKAVAGGGGKGMRVVDEPEGLEKAVISSGNEARSAFGDDRVFIEKCIVRPRHIEIQIARDKFGNAVYLGERECSIQRRHQKLIEEAPSPFVDEDLRKRMGKVAVEAVTAADYVNVGTVEFLVDANKEFYFLEVNTRLQVEHPVTELVTGIDLVNEQIAIAAGEKLSFKQENIKIQGHAIECRICAEDPSENFIPSAGRVLSYAEPSGPGVRVDSGIKEGSDVPAFYDSLVAKLITYGADRLAAIERMKQALTEYRIAGFVNNLQFHNLVMNTEAFVEGDLSTSFIPDNYPDGVTRPEASKDMIEAAAVAAALAYYRDSKRVRQIETSSNQKGSRWIQQGRAASVRKLEGGNW